MNQEIAYNLFSNFNSTVFKAVKAFLQKNNSEGTDKSITTTLRIPGEIKEFYECIAEAEMTSINTAIVSTLGKVKAQTINEYQKSYTKINDKFDYQINSFLKIIDDQNIDYNDLCTLLEWLTDTKISRNEITNKERLVNIINKEAQVKTCQIFGYSYDWLQDNKRSISYEWPSFQDRWYKNVIEFVRNLIKNFYLDETVESFQLSFLCCDKNLINNISSEKYTGTSESITPFVIANRRIQGIETITYHRLESNDINYEKCRKHFIVLIKMIFVLVNYGIISFPNGYLVPPQQHDMILDGSMHLAELFKNNQLYNGLCLDDLTDLEPHSFSFNDKNATNKPNLYHCLDFSVLHNILNWSEVNSQSTILTDNLASKCGMNKIALAKYLRLFDMNNLNLSKNKVFLYSKQEEPLIINLVRIKELQIEHQNCKWLDTSFG